MKKQPDIKAFASTKQLVVAMLTSSMCRTLINFLAVLLVGLLPHIRHADAAPAMPSTTTSTVSQPPVATRSALVTVDPTVRWLLKIVNKLASIISPPPRGVGNLRNVDLAALARIPINPELPFMSEAQRRALWFDDLLSMLGVDRKQYDQLEILRWILHFEESVPNLDKLAPFLQKLQITKILKTHRYNFPYFSDELSRALQVLVDGVLPRFIQRYRAALKGNLLATLDMLRKKYPEVDPEVWEQLRRTIDDVFTGEISAESGLRVVLDELTVLTRHLPTSMPTMDDPARYALEAFIARIGTLATLSGNPKTSDAMEAMIKRAVLQDLLRQLETIMPFVRLEMPDKAKDLDRFQRDLKKLLERIDKNIEGRFWADLENLLPKTHQ